VAAGDAMIYGPVTITVDSAAKTHIYWKNLMRYEVVDIITASRFLKCS
jgi:hypothetical protein